MHRKIRNPSYILLQFRNGNASNWASLCKSLNIHPDSDIAVYYLEDELRLLGEAGLLSVDGDVFSGNIKLSNSWTKIQTALGLSLNELTRVDNPRTALFVEPFFGLPEKEQPGEPYDLFVLMPFNDDLKPIYEYHIKNVATSLNLKAKRADDFFTADAIMRNIWSAIYDSHLVIADCTGRNPNVFYEIGIAHTLGRPVILIAQNKDDVPFDIRHIRYIQYDLTPRGLQDFQDRLRKTIQHELKISLPHVTTGPRDELRPYHQKILEFITRKGFIRDRDYAALVDRAKPTRRLDFNKLIELGLIVREGKGKNTYYVLKARP
jgi:hypothetical protein